jgi:hypothetical protein
MALKRMMTSVNGRIFISRGTDTNVSQHLVMCAKNLGTPDWSSNGLVWFGHCVLTHSHLEQMMCPVAANCQL